MLFNLHRLQEQTENCSAGKNTVVVVEGFFDCLKVHQAGITCVVALMGSSMSEAQQALLRGFEQVILFLDGDEPGREAAQSIATRLMYQSFVRVVNLSDSKQPDELSSEEIRSVLHL